MNSSYRLHVVTYQICYLQSFSSHAGLPFPLWAVSFEDMKECSFMKSSLLFCFCRLPSCFSKTLPIVEPHQEGLGALVWLSATDCHLSVYFVAVLVEATHYLTVVLICMSDWIRFLEEWVFSPAAKTPVPGWESQLQFRPRKQWGQCGYLGLCHPLGKPGLCSRSWL